MKAIFVCDNNPVYSGFWEHQAKYMWKRFHIPSLLYYLTDSESHSLFTSDFAEVRCIRLSPSTPSIIQALFAKWYFPCLENTTDKLFICDIDCFILSNEFVNIVKSEESLFHLTKMSNNAIPGYYVCGYSSQLREFFQVDKYPDFNAFCIERRNELDTRFVNADHISRFSKDATPDWRYFGGEEEYAGRCSAQYTRPVRNNIPAPSPQTNRICRSMNSMFNESALRNGRYIDYHCPRPYETYEKTITNILSKVFTESV
jgi:hypothetical protein